MAMNQQMFNNAIDFVQQQNKAKADEAAAKKARAMNAAGGGFQTGQQADGTTIATTPQTQLPAGTGIKAAPDIKMGTPSPPTAGNLSNFNLPEGTAIANSPAGGGGSGMVDTSHLTPEPTPEDTPEDASEASSEKLGKWGDQNTEVYDEMNAMYKDLLESHNAGWAATQDMVQRQGAANQRRAAALSAKAGSFGGGFAAMGAQALTDTNQQMLDERATHQEKARQLQLAWLDKKMQNQFRHEDKLFEEHMFDRGIEAEHEASELAFDRAPVDPKAQSKYYDDDVSITNRQHDSAAKELANKAIKRGINLSPEQIIQKLQGFVSSRSRLPKKDAEFWELLGLSGGEGKKNPDGTWSDWALEEAERKTVDMDSGLPWRWVP